MKRSKRYKKGFTIRLQTLGEKLYALRMARNESLRTVGKKVKMSPSLLSKMEKGQQNFRLSTLFKICIYYQVEPRDIINSPRTLWN